MTNAGMIDRVSELSIAEPQNSEVPFDINSVQHHLHTLNEMRKINEQAGDWASAEKRLSQIVEIRERAGHGLKASLNDKHNREEL